MRSASRLGLTAIFLTCLTAFSLPALASDTPPTTFALAPAVHNEVYVKGGLFGLGLGYARGINDHLTLRLDATTLGSISRHGTVSGFHYKGRLRNNMATAYADWFPFASSGFRLTAGVGVRDTRVNATGHPDSDGTMKIGDVRVPYAAGDAAHARVKFPSVTPYLGIGYGHNVAQHTQPGWGFVADAGVYFGRPTLDFHLNDIAMAELNAATGGQGQEEVDKEKHTLERKVRHLTVIPAVYLGVSYRF